MTMVKIIILIFTMITMIKIKTLMHQVKRRLSTKGGDERQSGYNCQRPVSSFPSSSSSSSSSLSCYRHHCHDHHCHDHHCHDHHCRDHLCHDHHDHDQDHDDEGSIVIGWIEPGCSLGSEAAMLNCFLQVNLAGELAGEQTFS